MSTEKEFQWTDDLVIEACYEVGLGVSNKHDIKRQIPELVKAFKISKMPIEVEVFGASWVGDNAEKMIIDLKDGAKIPEEKFPLIKQAIERCLNNEDDDETKIYSKEDHDILIEAAQSAAFRGARSITQVDYHHHPYRYPTFNDYKNSTPPQQ